MTHAHAPLTPTGRLRMVQRHLNDGIPPAHVAAEFRVSRPTVATWVARYRAEGEAGLLDRPSRPRRSPAQPAPEVVAQIQTLPRREKCSARRIHHHLVSEGHRVCLRTVGRWLHRAGLCRLRDLTPAGEDLRRQPAQRITAWGPGHMVHLDVKKIGTIPDGGKLACSRTGLRERASSQARAWPTGRLHLSALGDRRVHPPGLHRGVGG
ncbi:helix-turn-helix domain-containing protein [Micrococcus sp. HSID17245]|uniref:helix-turn-helix domain-containing protein n=1 Tax=Micrococcus sp. HSID17245 TaxID=2419508 RepID=UPI00210FDCF9|nr:leucine zipper domain-containing protein [Micrococcus sp. HSID17245]